MAKNIFIFSEQRDGVVANVSFELLGIARELANVTKKKVCAILIGKGVKKEAAKLIGYGADVVYVCDNKAFEHYMTEEYAQAVYQVVTEQQPNILLFGATSIGRDLAPRLSARLWTGLTADCTKLEADENGKLYMTRPAFGGNLFATIECPDHKPQMSTVRPGVMKKNEFDASRTGEIVEVKVALDSKKVKVKLLEEVKEVSSCEKIEEAKMLVSAGRGMAEHLDTVFQFAKDVGCTVSCSRALVDSGLVEQPRQVGQTGKTVRPQVYIACGISGAVQHLAGMEESEYIVAINKDKGASIFNVAHLGIVGDANKILPLLEKEIAEVRK